MTEKKEVKGKEVVLRGSVGRKGGPEADDQAAEDEITAALKKKDKK